MHLYASAPRSRFRIVFIALVVVLSSWLCCARSARSADCAPSIASSPLHSSGPVLGLSGGLFVPPQGGPLGAAAAGEVGYQLALARAAVAMSGRVTGFFSSDIAFAAALLSLRALWSLELVSPFVLAGVGPGYLGTPERVAATYQVGGGALMNITANATIGLEAAYTQLGAGSLRQLYFGPVLRARLD